MSKVEESKFYKTLLESTLAIPWKIDWDTKEFTYIGPQIESLLGWPCSSWKTAQDWIDRMHEDDREGTASYCIAQSEKGIDHEADYRAVKSDGSFVWIRDVVHVLREGDKTSALIGFMFDISERKALELELQELSEKNRKMAYVDELTNIPNRKAFNERFDMEFQRAVRNGSALSLLFIDIDHFKQYNDNYGHLAGDKCLISVAEIINRSFRRPADFSARFGGEEFIVILPETPKDEAKQLADNCLAEIRNTHIYHQASETSSHVTASIGLCTADPSISFQNKTSFLDKADQLLYRAKSNGRNRVEY